jgi:hypothetical protein
MTRHRHPPLTLLVAVASLALSAGCETPTLDLACDDLSGSLVDQGGLTVTEEEHPTGWGKSACLLCHSVERVHVKNCTGLDEVDIDEIRAIVDAEGTDSCVDCHGDNGVEP